MGSRQADPAGWSGSGFIPGCPHSGIIPLGNAGTLALIHETDFHMSRSRGGASLIHDFQGHHRARCSEGIQIVSAGITGAAAGDRDHSTGGATG